MAQAHLPEQAATKAAAESEFTTGEIKSAAAELHKALRSRFNHHYEHCKFSRSADYLVLRMEDTYWFALTYQEVREELQVTGVEIDDGLLETVLVAHLDRFQEMNFTLSFSRTMGQRLKDPFFYPIPVTPADSWFEGRDHAYQRLRELTEYRNMTPAEALDYWIIEESPLEPREWAGCRDVEPEAVRKNVRQAEDKISDPELAATHEKNVLQVERLEDIPEDLVNRDEGRYYMPTREMGRE